MPNAFKATSQSKGNIKTSRRINLSTLPLVTYQVKNNNFPSIRPIKKTKTTKEVFAAIVGKDKVMTKTFL